MEHNFDELISTLGKTSPAGEAVARSVYNALDDMTQRCDSSVEELTFRREAYDLSISVRIDELGANETNLQQVCETLMKASAICIFGYDEESLWLEIAVPEVFMADDFDHANTEVSFIGKKHEPDEADALPPEWLTEALRTLKEERGKLVFEDFAVNKQRFFVLADLYGAFKQAAADIGAEFVFQPPNLPTKEHGSCYLVAEKLTLQKINIDALFPMISQASSFGVNYCADNRVRLGVEVSDIYDRRE
ncbi:MAG: hypothetical protein FWC27_13260 [Firmicutes bacterium]|nr:hypothetical protein [Bacillota bacterium]